MKKEVFSYTNRQQKTHYFRAVRTKKGALRYYITRNPDAADLISEVPEGFEVAELPFDGKVVIRKKIPTHTHPNEHALVREAMKQHSPVKDFFITTERDQIDIYISQFNHHYDALYLSSEEAEELHGEMVNRWKKYDWIMSFELTDPTTRHFRVIRKAYVRYLAVPIDEGNNLAELAEKYCYHVGRESLLQFWIPGEDY